MLRKFDTILHAHPVAVAVVGVTAAVAGIIQFANHQRSRAWPQQWQCHARIQLGRFNHGRPEIYRYGPGTKALPLPYLAGLWEHLQSGDSISKQRGASRLHVLRDSAQYRIISDWAWNETTREFEFAGRSGRKR